jgi:hypothetical protein
LIPCRIESVDRRVGPKAPPRCTLHAAAVDPSRVGELASREFRAGRREV